MSRLTIIDWLDISYTQSLIIRKPFYIVRQGVSITSYPYPAIIALAMCKFVIHNFY